VKRRVASWVFLWQFFSNKSVRDMVSRSAEPDLHLAA
jgi:hypothetical protein